MLIGFPNTAVIAAGNGDGTFQLGSASLQTVYITQNFVDDGAMVVKTADFDLDGKPDAVVGDSYTAFSPSSLTMVSAKVLRRRALISVHPRFGHQ